MPTFAELEQFGYMNVVGPKGQHSLVGMETIFFEGLTGLIGTAYGIPGVTATRVATGAYRMNFPSSPQASGAMGVVLIPSLNAPTGNFFGVNVTDVHSVTGVAHLNFTTAEMQVSGAPTNIRRPVNPASGTRLHVLFYVSPITPF